VLKETTMAHLVGNFNSFKFTDNYVNASKRLREVCICAYITVYVILLYMYIQILIFISI
jgi:hypothetical protein